MCSVILYISLHPKQPEIEDYTLGEDDNENDKKNLDKIESFQVQNNFSVYGIYKTEEKAKERKKKLKFEQVLYCYRDPAQGYVCDSTITLDIFIKEESGMYIVYKTINYDIQEYTIEFYGEPFMISLEDTWYDEYTFHKKITVNQPIHISFQKEEDDLITEMVYDKLTTQWITPFWTPTLEFHQLLGAYRIMGPVFTIMLIDWRLQCQEDSELATQHTTQIAHRISLPTIPTEIWMEILRMLRMCDFGCI